MMQSDTFDDASTMAGGGATVLANRYRIVRQLGQGGMGSVWLAEDTALDNRQVAIKMLPSVLVANKRAYSQLKSEALVSLKLTHPNIASFRSFEENGGNPFLVIDYVEGQSLDDYLAEKGKLSEAETLRLLKPIAAALDYAHSRGVVHRDVKPANVMIAKDGTPYILDFGIAREIQETMTRVTGKLSSGTLMYMSPEQLHGKSPTAAQDVYSFAAMAYECLAGNPPFCRGQIEFQIEHDQPESLGDDDLAKSVMAGLAKSPDGRPKSCVELLERGLTAAKVEPVKADTSAKQSPSPVPSDDKKPRSFGSRRILAVLAGLLVVAVGVVGGVKWYEHSQATAERERQAQLERERKAAAERDQQAAEERERKAADERGCRAAEEARLASEKADRAAEEISFSLASRAESELQWISAEDESFRRFFAEEIRSIENDRRAGVDAKSNGRYVYATNYLTKALNRATVLKVSRDLRLKGTEAIAAAKRARDAAEKVEAVQTTGKDYDDAVAEIRSAEQSLENKQFAEALTAARNAERHFADIRTGIVSNLLLLARELQKAERWEECQAAAEKVLGWEPDNSEARQLKVIAAPIEFQYKLVEGNAVITNYTGSATDVVFPATLRGHPVTEIAGNAFYHGKYPFVNVAISEGIKKIGPAAFGYSGELETFSIPSTLVEFGEGTRLPVLYACPKLRQITVDAQNQAYKAVGGILYDKDGTTLVSCPANVDPSGSFTVPAAVRRIMPYAFNGSKFRQVILPPGLTKVERGTFDGAQQLTTMVIPPAVEEIGDRAFTHCYGLTNVEFSDRLTKIGEYAFGGANLERIEIPSSVREIGECAFKKYSQSRRELTALIVHGRISAQNAADKWGCNIENSKVWVSKEDLDYWTKIWGDGVMEYVSPALLGGDHKIGDERTIELPGGVKMVFCWCPAGEFLMGSPDSENGRDDEELQHRVRITKGFWMAKTEVTQAQWESVMGNNPSKFSGSNLPVEQVSWDDCQAFVQRVCAKTGLEIRLPTEAEWEYACRAGSTGPYYGKIDEIAWHSDNSEGKTHPVGTKVPNAWGLYDMSGNVREWCQDWYDSAYYASSAAEDPRGPASSDFRVLRGGCWYYAATCCRSASRGGRLPVSRNSDLGFRVACSAGSSK